MLIHCHLCKLQFYHQSWLHKIASSFSKSVGLVKTGPCWKQILHIKLQSFKLSSTYAEWHSFENLSSRPNRVKSTSQLSWDVILYPTPKDLMLQKCSHIKMLHKILHKRIWILQKAVTHLLCFTSEGHKHVDGSNPNPFCKLEGNTECSTNC